MTPSLLAPLSDEELDELDQFLTSDQTSEVTMSVDTLDGYLTAMVIGPRVVMPSQWLPGIWGPEEEDAPHYETMDQAKKILELIMRHMNGIIWSLGHDPDKFDPLLDIRRIEGDPHEYLDGEMWACGFMEGIKLNREDWYPLFDNPSAREALRPIYLLGVSSDEISAEDEALTQTPAQREKLSEKIAESVASIYRFWLPHREASREQAAISPIRHEQPKPGRNDPCPCGSGKKYKMCCGAWTTMH